MNLHCTACKMTFRNLEGQSYENFDEDYPPVCPICKSGMDLHQVSDDTDAYTVDYATMRVSDKDGCEIHIVRHPEPPPVTHHSITIGKHTYTPEQYMQLEYNYQQSLHYNFMSNI